MSPSSRGVLRYRVAHSGLCLSSARQVLTSAAAKGRFAELAQVLRDIHTRLEWIPLDFGEPLRDLLHLGLQEAIGVLPPLVVTFAVDEARRLVHVSVPFKLLSRSGL